jgi:NAD(P)-dependent dehydrogenase (short-subunit alcohol dehydrogenase family)
MHAEYRQRASPLQTGYSRYGLRPGGGAVIIVSSIGGLKGTDALGAYAISKGCGHADCPQPGCRVGA